MSVSEICISSPQSPNPPPTGAVSRFKRLSLVRKESTTSSEGHPASLLSRAGSERSLCSDDDEKEANGDKLYSQRLETLFRPAPEVNWGPNREIIVVGRPVTEKDRTLFNSAKTALRMSYDENIPLLIREEIGIQRQIRGTYFIKHIDPKVVELISKLIKSNAFYCQKSLMSALLTLRDWKGLRYFSPMDPHMKGEELIRHLIKLNASTIGVFKPRDEVRGAENCEDKRVQHSKDGIPPKLEGIHEVFVSGYYNLRRIPTAIEVQLEGKFYSQGSRETLVKKAGVLQEFIPNATTFAELSSNQSANIPKIPINTVQEIARIDLENIAVDRNLGNMLLSEDRIHLIDNALMAPRAFLSYGVLLWMTWPQAIIPFTEKSIQTIFSKDFEDKKREIQKAYPDYPPENLEVLRISDYLLKQGAREGLSPFQIGWLYTSTGFANRMQMLYTQAKRSSENDPEKTFENMKQYIDRAVYLLKTQFPDLVKEVDAQNLPAIEYGQALLKAMNDAAARFMPKFDLQ